MICPDCRTAGRNLREAVDNQDDVMYDNVAFLHSKCKGGNRCDCHHQVEGVNWEQLRLNSVEETRL